MKSFYEIYDKDTNEYILDNKYQEILVLDKLLDYANIPHETKRLFDGWQIIYPKDGACRICDAIEHFGSYGSEQDLLEIMGLISDEEEKYDSIVGFLTANDVFERIKNHYESNGGTVKNV